MRANGFVTGAALLTGLGLGGVALADALTSPDSQAIDPSFDIRTAEVTADAETLRFRMTVRGAAGARLPMPTGQLAGSEMLAYLWPTNFDSGIVGFPPRRGLLVLGLVSHPDLVETVGGKQLSSNWHPHWFVVSPGKSCGPFGLAMEEGPPATPGGLPVLTQVANLPFTIGNSQVEIDVPRKLLGDPGRLRYDGMTATLLVSATLSSPVVCLRVTDVASGRLTLTGTVTQQ